MFQRHCKCCSNVALYVHNIKNNIASKKRHVFPRIVSRQLHVSVKIVVIIESATETLLGFDSLEDLAAIVNLADPNAS